MVLCLALVSGGCARRLGVGGSTGPLEPLRVEREDLSDETGRKVHIRLTTAASATRQQVEELIRRTADEEPFDGGALWVSVFLEGMDPNSVAYAMGIQEQGRPIAIVHRESLQTYR